MGVRLHELQARLSPRFERFPHIRPWPFRRFEPKQPVDYAWAAWCSASLHDTRPPRLHAVLQEPCASCHRTVGRRHYSRPFHRTGEVDVTTRPCLGCGQLIASGSRCPQCKRPYTSAGRTRRARVVAEWINIYGAWCPGLATAGAPIDRPDRGPPDSGGRRWTRRRTAAGLVQRVQLGERSQPVTALSIAAPAATLPGGICVS